MRSLYRIESLKLNAELTLQKTLNNRWKHNITEAYIPTTIVQQSPPNQTNDIVWGTQTSSLSKGNQKTMPSKF
ncbi:hypothetical protein LINPERHAP2_LOCUS34669 [Linum perenne]